MTEVLHSPSSSSSTSSSFSPTTHNDALFQRQSFVEEEEEEDGISRGTEGDRKEKEKERDQLSLLALLVTLFRKSFWVACKTDSEELCGGGGMEIGWPSNVRHVAHVTFDRFNGFLGLPVEFELEVSRRAPSARWEI
ncbi:unnamed protein product [Ilex paraguariensis]|uniref:CRIB domain-containing protein n=1 Tax=Ilex paraguariensis TaxID=185542 RepID=A0ABC8TPF1_9AQUA